MTTQNIPISQFPVAISLDGTEEVPIVQAGVTKRTTTGAIGDTATGLVPTSRLINTPSEGGLAGGGSLAGDLSLTFAPFNLLPKTAMVVADAFAINDSSDNEPVAITFPNAMKALTGLPILTIPSLTNDYLVINHAADGLSYKINPSAFGLAFGNVPAGGTTAQVLSKVSDTDFDTDWANPSIGLNALSIAANPTGSTALAASVTLGATLAFSGTVLQTAAMTSDVTAGANSFVTTVAAIHGTTVSGTTGTTDVVFSNSPSLVTPALGVATATSLAIGGATLGSDALAVTGSATISSTVTGGTFVPTLNSIPTDGMYLNAAGQVAFAAGSTRIFFINSAGLLMANASGATLSSSAAGATTPTLIPRRSDSGTGIGSTGTASISLIATSIEQLRVNNGSIYIGGAATGSNIAAVAPVISGALSTGTGTNPDLIFQTGVKTTTGSSQATATTGLTLKGETQALLATGSLSILAGTAIPAGGIAGSGYQFSSTANYGVFFGSGAPTLSAAQGSLYLRSDGLPFYNTNGTTGWATLGGGTVTSVSLTMPAVFTVGGSPVTTSGTLAVTANGTSGGIPYFASTSTMASSALLVANAIVLGGGAGTTPVTLGSLGTTTTVLHGNAGGAPTFAAVSLTADVSGILPVGNGGTGLANPTVHDLLIGNGSSAMTQLAPSATSGVPVISQGASADPIYGTAVVAGGGTGVASFTAYEVICAGTTTTGALQGATIGTAGRVLMDNGASALPTFQAQTVGINFIIDGGGATIGTGIKGYLLVPFSCTISTWTLLADQSGSITVDVYNDAYSAYGTNTSMVGAGTKPAIASATKNQAAPASWTSTTIAAGSVIGFNVTAITTCQRVTIELTCSRTSA